VGVAVWLGVTGSRCGGSGESRRFFLPVARSTLRSVSLLDQSVLKQRNESALPPEEEDEE
jgi:hypothetical protein